MIRDIPTTLLNDQHSFTTRKNFICSILGILLFTALKKLILAMTD